MVADSHTHTDVVSA